MLFKEKVYGRRETGDGPSDQFNTTDARRTPDEEWSQYLTLSLRPPPLWALATYYRFHLQYLDMIRLCWYPVWSESSQGSQFIVLAITTWTLHRVDPDEKNPNRLSLEKIWSVSNKQTQSHFQHVHIDVIYAFEDWSLLFL